MRKKILSLLLVVAICLSFLITPSFATTTSVTSNIKILDTTLYGKIPVFRGVKPDNLDAFFNFNKNYSPLLFSYSYPLIPPENVIKDNALFQLSYGSMFSEYVVRWKTLFNTMRGIALDGPPFGFARVEIFKPFITYYDGFAPVLHFCIISYKADGTADLSYSRSVENPRYGCAQEGDCIRCYLTEEEMAQLYRLDELPDYTPPAEHSTAAFEVVNTVPNVNVKLMNNGNLIKGSTTLLVGFNLNSPTLLESLLWKADKPIIAAVRVGIGDSGKVETTNIINALTDRKPVITHWNTGRSYTLTLYAPDGVTEFGGDGSALYPLDTVTFTIDGEIPPSKELPVGNTTYSPTPPKTPATGDVNVIVNESGNITGVQQWDGNQWIIIEKIEINNNGGGSGGTEPDNPTDPDKPTDESIWDKLFGAIGKLISTIFKGILDILTQLVGTLIDGVITIVENLFKLLQSVVDFGGEFPNFLQQFFYFLSPEVVTLICLMLTLSIAIIVIKFFIK